MDRVLEVIRERRSVRRYTTTAVEDATVDEPEEAEAPIEEDVEEVSEGASDDVSAREAGELEEVVAAALLDEEDEDNENAEAAIEAELEIEDATAINEGAVLDVLLRHSGALPEHTDTGHEPSA